MAVSIATHGCATWKPSGEEPQAVNHGLAPVVTAHDAVGIETILVRLSATQSQRLAQAWSEMDEQAIAPELRISLDRNGMRASKVSGHMSPLLEEWVRETIERVKTDPIEQAGMAADITSYSQLWRCREKSKKELTVRKLDSEAVALVDYEKGPQLKVVESPHFLYSIQAAPIGISSAKVRLTPELQYGGFVTRVVAKDATARMESQRESLVWESLVIDLILKSGDCIVIGPSLESRGLGEHFFHTKTQAGEIQPVLLIVRLSESESDDAFSRH